MTTTIVDTKILSENITYNFPQDLLLPTVDFSRKFESAILPFENLFEKKTAEQTSARPFVFAEEEILRLAKRYYEENKETLLKKYKGKYIAIFNNKVIGSDKDFSKLAQRVYKKYGYQTIYIPFVDTKEKVVNIPSPSIRIL